MTSSSSTISSVSNNNERDKENKELIREREIADEPRYNVMDSGEEIMKIRLERLERINRPKIAINVKRTKVKCKISKKIG